MAVTRRLVPKHGGIAPCGSARTAGSDRKRSATGPAPTDREHAASRRGEHPKRCRLRHARGRRRWRGRWWRRREAQVEDQRVIHRRVVARDVNRDLVGTNELQAEMGAERRRLNEVDPEIRTGG